MKFISAVPMVDQILISSTHILGNGNKSVSVIAIGPGDRVVVNHGKSVTLE